VFKIFYQFKLFVSSIGEYFCVIHLFKNLLLFCLHWLTWFVVFSHSPAPDLGLINYVAVLQYFQVFSELEMLVHLY